jgi:hypothetical protein
MTFVNASFIADYGIGRKLRERRHPVSQEGGVVFALRPWETTMQQPTAIQSHFAEVNGTRLHYLLAGQGDPVLLLHGYAQTSHMWRPLMAELAATHSNCARPARVWRIGEVEKRLPQEIDGARHGF